MNSGEYRLIRGRLDGFLLGFFGPWRSDAIHSSIGDGLTQVLVIMGNQDVDHVAVICIGTQLLLGFCKICVGHFLDGRDGIRK